MVEIFGLIQVVFLVLWDIILIKDIKHFDCLKGVIKLTIEDIKRTVLELVPQYDITSIVLFGSRANGTAKDDSDVDLILEFSRPVSLLTLSQIKIELEEKLGLDVDVIHGPITDNDMIVVDKEIVLYAA